MRNSTTLLLAGAAALMLKSAPALADPVEETGAAAASVVNASRVTHISDLRFGAFASPATASTLRVTVNGAVIPTGAVTTTMNVPQPASGRGPAQFGIEQANVPLFIAYIPTSITISNGTETMNVSNVNGRLVRTVNRGRNSIYRLDVGGTLNINGNQAQGSYSGDFIVTVLYL